MRLLGERPGDLGRRYLERALRGVSFVALLWLLMEAIVPRSIRPLPIHNLTTDSLTPALTRLRAEAPAALHVLVDGDISPVQRDWLAALGASGTEVTWSGLDVFPTAAVAEPVADPRGSVRVLAASPRGISVRVADAYGVLDSLRAEAGGGRFVFPWMPNEIRVQSGPLTARITVPDSLRLRRLLVLGAVGWESKFVVAALEEAGWDVVPHLFLSPKGDVTSGAEPAIDTARYSAVVALDTTALRFSAQLARFVDAGGGLVITADASAHASMDELHFSVGGAHQREMRPFDRNAALPRTQLGLNPVALRNDAVPIEFRDRAIAIAARRVQRGRVVVTGYEDTWRWRLAGSNEAARQHRDWWVALVASVARVSYVPRSTTPRDEAPLAHLVTALGPPSAKQASLPSLPQPPTLWLFAVLMGSLLAEWSSRRARGAR